MMAFVIMLAILAPAYPAVSCADRTNVYHELALSAHKMLFNASTFLQRKSFGSYIANNSLPADLTSECALFTFEDYEGIVGLGGRKHIAAHIVRPVLIGIGACSPYIRANYLYIYEDWADQLRDSPAASEYEKQEVLGTIYMNALRAVTACCTVNATGDANPRLNAILGDLALVECVGEGIAGVNINPAYGNMIAIGVMIAVLVAFCVSVIRRLISRG